jgi:aminoglycoside phosphotransferase (APT) family kinase protein
MSEDLITRVCAYISHRQPHVSDITISEFARIHGGASRETYRVTARWREQSVPVEQRLILRRDPVDSLIETERDLEFNAYRAFHGSAVPVPKPLWLEMDPQWLDRPFFVMEQVTDCKAASPFAADPYGALAQTIGEQFWRTLGHVAAADPHAIGLAAVMPAPNPATCWQRELDHWERVIDADELHPQPIVRAAIRKLRREPPPPPRRLAVVHGDYRTGNFLYDDAGRIRAVLDWEMCHLGDPLEDLAWAMDPLWAGAHPDRPGGMIDTQTALSLWQQTSGLDIDTMAFDWWRLFAMVKGLGIWISSSHAYVAGRNRDPVLAFSGWYCTDVHNRRIVERLAPPSDTATAEPPQ